MAKVKIGAVNMIVKSYGYEENAQKMLAFIDQAGKEGIKLLVFPEAALQGYMEDVSLGSPEHIKMRKYFRKTAETIPGPFCDEVQKLCKQYDMIVQVGMAESALGGEIIYNSAAVVGPGGVMGVFRKLHNQCECIVFSAGNDIIVVDTPVGKIAPFICYDLAFPEINRVQVLKGAQILTMTTAWPMKGKDVENDHYAYCYDIMSRSSAMFNQAWMVCSNHTERKEEYWEYGHSRIISPDGYIIAEIGEEEGIVSAEVDVEGGITESRTESFFGLSLLQDRRPEFYGIIADKDVYYQK